MRTGLSNHLTTAQQAVVISESNVFSYRKAYGAVVNRSRNVALLMLPYYHRLSTDLSN